MLEALGSSATYWLVSLGGLLRQAGRLLHVADMSDTTQGRIVDELTYTFHRETCLKLDDKTFVTSNITQFSGNQTCSFAQPKCTLVMAETGRSTPTERRVIAATSPVLDPIVCVCVF